MKHPIDQLMQDHRLIENVLEALEGEMSPRPLKFYEQVIDFITHFADAHHHEKEEQLLFPALAARGIPVEGGPIGCMLHEHDEGRMHVARMREAVAADDTEAAARAGANYAALLRAHIAKEDGVLFPMARRVLLMASVEELVREFDSVGSRMPDRDRFRRLADELRESIDRPLERGT